MKKYVLRVVLLGAALFTAFGAQAAQQCGTRDLVLDRLTDKYGESRQSMGLAANNGVLEIFASKETGTWTILVTQPDGKTCLIASGQAFEDAIELEVAVGDDA